MRQRPQRGCVLAACSRAGVVPVAGSCDIFHSRPGAEHSRPPIHARADVLSEAGHSWVGLDISGSMLEIAVAREVDGDMLMTDMGQGFGFRAGMFDGVVR